MVAFKSSRILNVVKIPIYYCIFLEDISYLSRNAALIRKKVRRNGSNNVIPLVLFQDLSFYNFLFLILEAFAIFIVSTNKYLINTIPKQIKIGSYFYAIANASYIDELVKDPEKRHINYLLELRSIHSKDISKNYKQFRTKKQWMQQELPYDVPLMKDFPEFLG